jgi:uncharacterized protein YjcR
LANAERRKSILEQTIANCLSERERLAAAISEKTDLLNRSQARASVLREELRPYEVARARIAGETEALQASLNAAIDRFDTALPR